MGLRKERVVVVKDALGGVNGKFMEMFIFLAAVGSAALRERVEPYVCTLWLTGSVLVEVQDLFHGFCVLPLYLVSRWSYGVNTEKQ